MQVLYAIGFTLRNCSLALGLLCLLAEARAQIRIPVVVHIISNNPDAVPDALVRQGIEDLNQAFAHTGPYAGGPGANTGISFCLARRDPDGGITDGITRTRSPLANMDIDIEDKRLKNLISWDTRRYMNIWLVESVEGEMFAEFRCGQWTREKPGGYATFMPGGDVRDGIVAPSFGPSMARFAGTYLGLRMIFTRGSCQNNNCAVDGDGVCDTPPMSVTGGSCTNPQNSCSSDTLSGFNLDQRDMNANFMTFSACINMFTEGQANKMRNVIATQRSGLVNNNNACEPPCAENILARYDRDNWNPVPGNTITFTSQSTGGSNYEWLVDEVPTGGNSPQMSYTFANAGKYKVTLRVYNGNRNCFASYSHNVIVTCGVLASFYPDKRTIASKYPYLVDTIRFTNRSANATSYQWLIRNDTGMAEQVVSTAQDLAYPYLNKGRYEVRLVAINGSCRDTSGAFIHTVQDAVMDGTAYAYNAECYQDTKVRLSVYVCNNGYDTIPRGVPISFYDAPPTSASAQRLDSTFLLPNPVPGRCCGQVYTLILESGKVNINQVYVVFNDRAVSIPVRLPNTDVDELSYGNNTTVVQGFRFTASIAPPAATLQPGDTLTLSGRASPGLVSRFNWTPATNLSCSVCVAPQFVATRSDTRIKMVATSANGCSDSAFANIRVPPADDFTLAIDTAECYGQDSMRVEVEICNIFKRGFLPQDLKLSFYDGDPAAGGRRLGDVFRVPDTVNSSCGRYTVLLPALTGSRLFGVVNDNGRTPFGLPNDTVLAESNYQNNRASYDYRPFRVRIDPSAVTLQPGDTVRFRASSTGGAITQYAWSPAAGLGCMDCPDPQFIAARADRSFRLVGQNAYGCSDTANAEVRVPPVDDLTVRVLGTDCYGADSILLRFEICNSYARGIIPEGTKLSFYDADPRSGGQLLGPIFAVPAGAGIPCTAYQHVIRSAGPRTIYAVINDRNVSPFALPNDTLLAETNYNNNITPFDYAPETVRILPSDTAVLLGNSIDLRIGNDINNPASVLWSAGNGNPISCTGCLAPRITVNRTGTVQVQMRNRYGCLLRGETNVRILPPDMTLAIDRMECYASTTSLVYFRICMNNNYDSLFRGIPVRFYDADPARGGARPLGEAFLTPEMLDTSCGEYSAIVNTPGTGLIWGAVNDRGQGPFPDRAFEETNYTNNTASIRVVPFRVQVMPSDTFIYRNSSVQLLAGASGGRLTAFNWQPSQYLSCTQCLDPIARVPYSVRYVFTGTNQHNCTASDTVQINMYTDGPVNIPNAFTPNGDGKNDVFYVLGSRDVERVKDFSIYDRLGQRVFQARDVPPNDPVYGWKGDVRGMVSGTNTFAYVVVVRFRDGREQMFKGTVTVIR